ncbi:MAG: adenosylmethionine decarboxylase [Bacteroidota bacterium]
MTNPQEKYSALGRHVLLELHDCPAHLLERPPTSEAFLLAAAERMHATVVSSHFHAFSPYGVSGVVIIQESHLTIHTWPEYGYAAIDIFTCGQLQIEEGVQYLFKAFEAQGQQVRELTRGIVLNASTCDKLPER